MPQVTLRTRSLAGALLLVLGTSLRAQQQVQVLVNAVPNPVPAGSCAGIWVEVRDAAGQRLANVDGIQLYPNSYDYMVPNGASFAWRNNDPASGYLCTRAEAGADSTPVIATIRGTARSGSTMLALQPGPARQVASAAAVGAPPAAGAAPTSPPAGATPGQPYVAQPAPAAVPPQQTAYQPAVTPVQPPAAAAPQTTAVATQATLPPAPPPQAEKGVGSFFKKIGKHIKQRASEVTSATAENLATSATRLADTTLQTGSGVVSGTVAGVSNMAQVKVGGAGKSLLPTALRLDGSSDNLSLALGSGRAVLRAMRFDPATGQLTPASLELARRVAEELKLKQARWVIEAYVDPGPGDQELSEYRAGLVKAALIHFGVPGESLMALGYGPSKLEPQVPADGGTPSAAHIDIAQRAE